MMSAVLFGSPRALAGAPRRQPGAVARGGAGRNLTRALERDLETLATAGHATAPLPEVLAQARAVLAACPAPTATPGAATEPRSTRIARLNDGLRASCAGGLVVPSESVRRLPPADQAALLAKVQTFDAFNSDNDPHQEHDFGAVEHGGRTWWWKIDAYAPNLSAARSPADPPARSGCSPSCCPTSIEQRSSAGRHARAAITRAGRLDRAASGGSEGAGGGLSGMNSWARRAGPRPAQPANVTATQPRPYGRGRVPATRSSSSRLIGAFDQWPRVQRSLA